METLLKSCHYEILNPNENDLIFCFEGQDIFLKNNQEILRYGEFKHISEYQGSFYCFAELENLRYLLLDDPTDLTENPEISRIGLRELVYTFPSDTFPTVLKACHLGFWRKTHRFCGHCGTKLVESEVERARVCKNCGQITYPRISPCIIALITRGEEMLLARSPHFPPEVYSTLAGFVEPGESAEECLRREIEEEVGVQIKNIRYFGSQPWPFPDSLMLGFTADYDSGEIRIDEKEIEDAKWYSPKHLPKLPLTFSIARALIDQHLKKYPAK